MQYDGTFEKDIADQLRKVATGELEVAYPFSAKDWRHNALALLLWDAADKIAYYQAWGLDHKWDGPLVSIESNTVHTCSKCGKDLREQGPCRG